MMHVQQSRPLGFYLCISLAAGLSQSARTVIAGDVFNNTGANTCATATVVPVSVGPVGNPTVVTIFGDNSTATAGDGCTAPIVGATWWEAFQLSEDAVVKVDLCGTTPPAQPAHALLVRSCPSPCPRISAPEWSYGDPICPEENLWMRFGGLPAGTYYYPLISAGATGPYELHITAQALPPLNAGPDVITSEIVEVFQLGREGGVGEGTVGLGVGTSDCNVGDELFIVRPLPDTQHALIHANMYRLMTVEGTGRFEQIGQSWIKHTFGAFYWDGCDLGCACATQACPGDEQRPRCSDTYYAVQFEPCSMGPRSAIHPYTGAMSGGADLGPGGGCDGEAGGNFPAANHLGHNHPGSFDYAGIDHRLQVRDADLVASQNPGARYFVEAGYFTPDEFAQANGNQNNNISHREFAVSGPDVDGVFLFTPLSSTFRESPAVDAWPGAEQQMIEPFPGADGRAFLAYQVTNLGGGMWRYEYVLYNMNLDASIRSLSVPVAPGVLVSNVGFHAPPQHAAIPNGDNYSSTPWSVNSGSGAITWSTDDFATDALANAIRYGTTYTFRFDATSPPGTATATLGLFKTGGSRQVDVLGPTHSIPAVSEWGLIVLILAIATAGAALIRTRANSGG